MNGSLTFYLTVTAGLVALGFLALMIRRDVRGVLVGVGLIVAAAVVNLVAAARVLDDLAGPVAALVVLALETTQVVVLTALARAVGASRR